MKKILLLLTILLLFSPAYTQDRLKINVDPRVELLSTMLSVSDYDSIMVSKGSFHLISQLDFKYKNQLLLTFGSMQSHPVIELFMDMAYNYGFFYSFPIQACLLASAYPEMRINKPVPDLVLTRSGGIENLNTFLNELVDFGNKSGFELFMQKHRDYYLKITRSVEEYQLNEMINQIEDYYQDSMASYNIILVSMLHGGGYGPIIRDSLDNEHVYSIIGPKRIIDGLPHFGSLEEFRYTIWHEFSHSFVNPVVDSLYQEIEPYSALFAPIKEKMKIQSITDWKDCITEHIVRAVTIRLEYLYLGEKAGDKAKKMEMDMGFHYVDEICEILEIYETGTDTYSSFADFFPAIITLFENMEEELSSGPK